MSDGFRRMLDTIARRLKIPTEPSDEIKRAALANHLASIAFRRRSQQLCLKMERIAKEEDVWLSCSDEIAQRP